MAEILDGSMTIHLVRHASAGRRTPATADFDRPLDEVGRSQASAISAALATQQLMQVLSSPSMRCQQTVAPLAEALGVKIDVLPDLAEGQPAARTVAMLHRLAAAGVRVALCSHGDIIPRALDTLAADGVALAGTGCAKGSVWTLTVTHGLITDGRYHPSP